MRQRGASESVALRSRKGEELGFVKGQTNENWRCWDGDGLVEEGGLYEKKSRKLEVLSRSGEKEKEGRPARTGILIL